jgi:hypothetical protein
VLRALPADVPWAIEYPLVGNDLLAVVQQEIAHLRGVAAGLANATGSDHPALSQKLLEATA